MKTQARLQFMLHPTDKWRVGVGCVALLIVVLVATGEWLFQTEGISVAFSLPVSVVTWIYGAPWGMTLAVFCGALGPLLNLMNGTLYASGATPAMNAAVRIGALLVVAWLVVEGRQTIEWLVELVGRDVLTGVHNRHGFTDLAALEFDRARRARHPLTVAYLDLDGFKSVNDEQGHLSGDDLLRHVGGVLRAQTRTTDVVARLGGDEFALILPEMRPEEASATLNAIRRRVIASTTEKGWPVTSSLGAVTFMVGAGSVTEALQRADALMYRVKKGSKNQVAHEVVSPNGPVTTIDVEAAAEPPESLLARSWST